MIDYQNVPCPACGAMLSAKVEAVVNAHPEITKEFVTVTFRPQTIRHACKEKS